jgi:hypothetical protein
LPEKALRPAWNRSLRWCGIFLLESVEPRTRSFSPYGRRWCGHKSAPDEGSPSAAQLQFFARVKQKPLTRRTLRVRRPLPQGERYEVWRALENEKSSPGASRGRLFAPPVFAFAVLGFRRLQPETALLPAPFQCTTRGSAHFDWRLAGATRTGTAGVGNLLAIQADASYNLEAIF